MARRLAVLLMAIAVRLDARVKRRGLTVKTRPGYIGVGPARCGQ